MNKIISSRISPIILNEPAKSTFSCVSIISLNTTFLLKLIACNCVKELRTHLAIGAGAGTSREPIREELVVKRQVAVLQPLCRGHVF